MLLSELILIFVLLTQAWMGLLGNSVLLVVYSRIFISQPNRRKPTDLIFTHLSTINVVTMLIHGATVLIFATGIENKLEDVGCHIISYFRRVTRGLSICTTCLLSVFQAITRLKPQATGCITPSLVFFWILHLSMYMNILTATIPTYNVTGTVNRLNIKYCSDMFLQKYLTNMAFVVVITLRDVVFVLLMTWASGDMVLVLYQHHIQVRHIHSTNLSPRSSPETRATCTILLLVTCFVFFYSSNCIIILSLTFLEYKDIRLTDAMTVLGACYPALCPWVLISSDPRVPKPHCILKKERSPSPPLDLCDV
ncbi:vomeronasal type-1 receptor 4-like [Ornithorhynchus anatinus]|uniref:vomeronasal type-1 receptor 4-like n=1 Tax=Ornithorhynchus anatinus TaxID=9258 RepID=UPI0010A80850|nr:vomeronasal type-1 receptor 4-like [Ornithorhynchus anatinus]